MGAIFLCVFFATFCLFCLALLYKSCSILFLSLRAFQGSNALKESCFTRAKHSLCSVSQKSHECAVLIIVAGCVMVHVYSRGAFRTAVLPHYELSSL